LWKRGPRLGSFRFMAQTKSDPNYKIIAENRAGRGASLRSRTIWRSGVVLKARRSKSLRAWRVQHRRKLRDGRGWRSCGCVNGYIAPYRAGPKPGGMTSVVAVRTNWSRRRTLEALERHQALNGIDHRAAGDVFSTIRVSLKIERSASPRAKESWLTKRATDAKRGLESARNSRL